MLFSPAQGCVLPLSLILGRLCRVPVHPAKCQGDTMAHMNDLVISQPFPDISTWPGAYQLHHTTSFIFAKPSSYNKYIQHLAICITKKYRRKNAAFQMSSLKTTVSGLPAAGYFTMRRRCRTWGQLFNSWSVKILERSMSLTTAPRMMRIVC